MSIYVPYAWPETAPANQVITDVLRHDLGQKVIREFQAPYFDHSITSMVTDADHLTGANLRRSQYFNQVLGMDVLLLCSNTGTANRLRKEFSIGNDTLLGEPTEQRRIDRLWVVVSKQLPVAEILKYHVDSQEILQWSRSEEYVKTARALRAEYPRSITLNRYI